MKNLKITVAALGLIILSSACRMNSRHVIISDGDNHNSTRIEYSGRAFFNGDSTAITHITPNGYVKYKRDGQELIAKGDNHGGIVYRINNSDEQTHLNAGDKTFLAQAVKDMIKHGHNND
ncbi:MAG: hypothetical protein JWQ34_3313 [Mucilaginibacter sp.]|uniref:hypothetical protein n=1 Tax=Mucilaginibacter sp. TaxID=1882438 RepID=UPI00261901DD|nr:hypothetical protein [Mucilaginibacter sp.]MDB5005088.1 hypothetical protein [Mucilaginibacter sp.]